MRDEEKGHILSRRWEIHPSERLHEDFFDASLSRSPAKRRWTRIDLGTWGVAQRGTCGGSPKGDLGRGQSKGGLRGGRAKGARCDAMRVVFLICGCGVVPRCWGGPRRGKGAAGGVTGDAGAGEAGAGRPVAWRGGLGALLQ